MASELPNCASRAFYCQERLVNLLELTWEGPGLLDRKELGSSSPSLGRLEMQHMAEGVTPPLRYIAGFEVRSQEVPQQGRRWALRVAHGYGCVTRSGVTLSGLCTNDA